MTERRPTHFPEACPAGPIPGPTLAGDLGPTATAPPPSLDALNPQAGVRPLLLIVGERHQTRRVRRALADLPFLLAEHVDLRHVLERELTPAVAGLILVPPLRGIVVEHAVGLALERSPDGDLPVFAVVPEGFSDARSASLYDRGAAGVLSWTTDAEMLPSVILQVLGTQATAPAEADADRALARVVRSRLRASRKLDRSVRLSVRRGAVRLAGRVRALWKRRRLQEQVAQMPGVQAVDAGALHVEPGGRTDGEIAAAVRELLGGVASVDDHTLAVSVHDGHVVLTGTVLIRDEWSYARELISRVEGVRSVTNKTAEAPRRKRRDAGRARRLRAVVRKRLPGTADVRVAVIGDTAVLRGRVPAAFTRRVAERVVSTDVAIGRVINRLRVAF